MNVVIIILGICVVVLLYILYAYFMSNTVQLATSVSLTSNTGFNSSQITNSTSVNYAYGMWVYVNTWNSTNIHYILLANLPSTPSNTTSAAASATTGANQPNPTGLNLYLDPISPTLYYDIGLNGTDACTSAAFVSNTGFVTAASTTPKNSGSQKITTNFPIQAWVQIIVSVNGNIVDIYLNGQLVTSKQYNVAPPTISPNPAQLGLQGQNFDATVANFTRWSKTAVDPQMAMSSYLSGNGQASVFSNYNMSVDLTQNNNPYVHYNVF